MLNETNDTSSFLDEFEDESKSPNIDDSGKDKNVDNIEAPAPDEIGMIDSIDEDQFTDEPETEKEETKLDEIKTEENKEEDKFSYKAFLSHLNEEGYIEFEDREDLEDTPEVVYESVKKTIDQGIQSYKESIPEKGKQLLDYLEKGGDINKFIDTLQRPLDLDSLDLDSEKDQEKVMREYLKSQDYTNDEIDETITDYKDGLLLDKQAKVAAKKLEKAFEKRNENLIKAQEQEAELRAQEYNKNIELVSSTIDNSTSLAGLDLTAAEKLTFKKYLLAKDKEGLTTYEREIMEDPVKTQLELAYLKFKKYDFGKAKKQGETEASKKLNWKLKNNDTTVKGKSSTEVKEEESSLSAFEWFKAKQKG